MQFLNTLTVLALVVASFALIVAVPVLYASSEDSGRSNRLILLGSAVWVALVLLNWGVSFFLVCRRRRSQPGWCHDGCDSAGITQWQPLRDVFPTRQDCASASSWPVSTIWSPPSC